MNFREKLPVVLLAFIGVSILAGCSSFLTATSVIEFRIHGGEINTLNELSYVQVDLTEEDVWKDHKDDIKNIDDVGFELWLTNDTNYSLTGEVYIAPFDSAAYTTAAEAEANASLILQALNMPAGATTYIDWPTSLDHMANVETLKGFAEEGKFTIYALTTTLPFKMTVDSATVIVTVTYGVL